MDSLPEGDLVLWSSCRERPGHRREATTQQVTSAGQKVKPLVLFDLVTLHL